VNNDVPAEVCGCKCKQDVVIPVAAGVGLIFHYCFDIANQISFADITKFISYTSETCATIAFQRSMCITTRLCLLAAFPKQPRR